MLVLNQQHSKMTPHVLLDHLGHLTVRINKQVSESWVGTLKEIGCDRQRCLVLSSQYPERWIQMLAGCSIQTELDWA